MNEQFLKSTAFIIYHITADSISYGTGFFVLKPIERERGFVFLVTNKHVLPPKGTPISIRIRVRVGPAGSSIIRWIEIPVVGSDHNYLPNVKVHPDDKYDIAAINITEQVIKDGIDGAWLPIDLFCTKEKIKSENITIGDEVYILGYPASIFEEKNISPILRIGVISSTPLEGYSFNKAMRDAYGLPDHLDGFLCDANLFPGSSGSVVILKPQATTIGQQGETVVSGMKKIPYIMGIVSHSFPINDTALGTVQRMGLGIVFSSEAIKTVIDQYFK